MSPFLIASGMFFFGVLIGFVGGALFFRKHGDRIVADVAKVSAVAQNVADTTKKL